MVTNLDLRKPPMPPAFEKLKKIQHLWEPYVMIVMVKSGLLDELFSTNHNALFKASNTYFTRLSREIKTG